MKNVVLIPLLSCGFVFNCFPNTNLDSLYKRAFYTDSMNVLLGFIPEFEAKCNSSDKRYLYKFYFLVGCRAALEKKSDVAFTYYSRAYDIANELGNNDYKRSVMLNMSMIYYSVDDFFNAKVCKLKAIEFTKMLGDQDKVASYLCDIGVYYRRQGNIDSAVYYLEKSYSLEVKQGDLTGQSLALNELGLCAYDVKDYNQALEYYAMALNLNDTSSQIKYMVFTNQGLAELKKRNLDKSKELLHMAIAVKRGLGKAEKEFIPQFNLLGEIYVESGEYDSALAVFNKALMLNNYNGMKGANSEELYLTMRYMYKIQEMCREKYLLTDLGVYDRFDEFLQWQENSRNQLEKLSNRLALRIAKERVNDEKRYAMLKNRMYWFFSTMFLCIIGFWITSEAFKKKKKEKLLKKIEQFDEQFEDKYDEMN